MYYPGRVPIDHEDTLRHLSLATAIIIVSSGCALIPPADVPPLSGTSRQVVVLDIDGTLTPRNIEFSTPRESAADAINAFHKKGYTVVYLTTRVPAFQSNLPDWLARNGFPDGPLHVAQTANERANPADYKARVMGQYIHAGWRLAYAYGDSTTDLVAYSRAGLPRDRVFALKRKHADHCQEGVYEMCLESWAQHMSFIENEVPETVPGEV